MAIRSVLQPRKDDRCLRPVQVLQTLEPRNQTRGRLFLCSEQALCAPISSPSLWELWAVTCSTQFSFSDELFVESSDSFPVLWESPYYLLQAFKGSVLSSTHTITLRVLSKLVLWFDWDLSHYHTDFSIMFLFRVVKSAYWYISFPWRLKIYGPALLFLLSFLSLFGCCFLRKPGNVVIRLLLIFHLGNSGVATQSETIWSQFHILPFTPYSGLSLAAWCRKLLCWTEPSTHGSNGMWHISIYAGHITIYAPVNNPFRCISFCARYILLELSCSQEDLL